jgi:hypothetical protein
MEIPPARAETSAQLRSASACPSRQAARDTRRSTRRCRRHAAIRSVMVTRPACPAQAFSKLDTLAPLTVRFLPTPHIQGEPIRQRLLAHSDAERSYSYEFCGSSPFPVSGYQATLRVTSITDGDRAFAGWWATFDCADADRDRWVRYFEREGSPSGWLRCAPSWPRDSAEAGHQLAQPGQAELGE